MGRHGGGSSSGGRSSSSRSSSGSSSRGGGVRTSHKPFNGCYGRSYYDRHGRCHTIYTSDSEYGTKPGFSLGIIVALVFITLHMTIMLSGMISSSINFGKKVNGNADRIFIEDSVDILTYKDEEQLLELFGTVYKKSGMPITLYTDNYDWKTFYQSLEVYSEQLYYSLGLEEDAMVIVFTIGDNEDFYDWEYDMYCGDDTIDCLSDKAFDKLLNNFQKAMAKGDLNYALTYSWESVMDDLAETSFSAGGLLGLPFLVLIYGVFYFALLGTALKQHKVYKYYKKNPTELSMKPIRFYSECPNCGASNSSQGETCAYCGTLLKISDSEKEFV